MAFNFNFGFLALVVLALVSVANAHMKMSSPVPFNVANLDNSPLKADGSDYPCKASPDNPSSYSISAMNNIPVDSAVALTFDGSAVHGGGTCQLSISLDKEPTKDSVFKVIQTYQGSSCPSATGGGLTFNIPKDFPNAERATLAWSWQNRIGNREMYMNCAPIAITGGSDNGQAYYESLPDIFKANIPTSDCLSEESTDPSPPNPGEFVLQDSSVKPGKVTGPKCGTAAPAQNQNSAAGKVTNLAAFSKPAKDSNVIVPVSGGSGTGSGSASGGASSAPGGNDGMSPSQPSSAPTASYNNGLYTQPAASAAQPTSIAAPSAASSAVPSATAPVSSASSAAPSSTFSTLTVPASSATPSAYPTLSPTLGQGVSGLSTGSASPTGSDSSSSGSAGSSGQSTSSPSSSSGSTGSSGQCTTDGAIVCNGSTQFGICDHGSVVWQAVAAGTTCSNSAILKRSQPVLPPLPRHHARAFHKVRFL